MSAARTTAQILSERLEITLALGEANAAQHRAQAEVGGASIELMGCEERGETGALAEAQARDAAAKARLAAAEARVEALQTRLAALDTELAGAGADAR
ncbi:MAG: hypothetical protein AAF074_02565 [Pseudomonadota bacterium]